MARRRHLDDSDQPKVDGRWCERMQRFYNATDWVLHKRLCEEHGPPLVLRAVESKAETPVPRWTLRRLNMARGKGSLSEETLEVAAMRLLASRDGQINVLEADLVAAKQQATTQAAVDAAKREVLEQKLAAAREERDDALRRLTLSINRHNAELAAAQGQAASLEVDIADVTKAFRQEKARAEAAEAEHDRVRKAIDVFSKEMLFGGRPDLEWYEDKIFNEERLYEDLGKEDARSVLGIWRRFRAVVEAVRATAALNPPSENSA